MHYLDSNEKIQHRTGDYPLAYYPVNTQHPRYQMRTHWHREAELIRVESGRLNLYIDERAIRLCAGDLMLVGEGVIHGGDPESCEYGCIVFDTGLLTAADACKRALKTLLSHSLFLDRAAVEADPELSAAVARLYGRCAAGVAGGELGVTGALYELFSVVIGHRCDARLEPVSDRFLQKADQLKPALEYIETHYAQPISLDGLARQTGFSPKYFCRFFKTIVHRSPIDYVNYYRVECASHFLTASDMSVAEIAQSCGFNDSSFFIKQFRKYKNTTPHRYRAESFVPGGTDGTRGIGTALKPGRSDRQTY